MYWRDCGQIRTPYAGRELKFLRTRLGLNQRSPTFPLSSGRRKEPAEKTRAGMVFR